MCFGVLEREDKDDLYLSLVIDAPLFKDVCVKPV